MPKRRKPLPSEAVSGKMDEKTIFSTRHGKTYSKRNTKPKQPNTKAQMEARAAFSWAMRLWQRWLKGDEREAWRAFAARQKKVDRVTGGVTFPMAHSVFIRHAVHCRRAGFDPPRLPPKGLSPQPVPVDLSPKGKGLAVPPQRKSVKRIHTTRGTEGGMGEKFSHVWGCSASPVVRDERRRGACPLSGSAAPK